MDAQDVKEISRRANEILSHYHRGDLSTFYREADRASKEIGDPQLAQYLYTSIQVEIEVGKEELAKQVLKAKKIIALAQLKQAFPQAVPTDKTVEKVKPAGDEGLPAQRPLSEVDADALAENDSGSTAKVFKHSPSYNCVNVENREFTLTPRQAEIIKVLHEAYNNGTPELHLEEIKEILHIPGSVKLRDRFRNAPDAWKHLVTKGKRKGTLRLNV